MKRKTLATLTIVGGILFGTYQLGKFNDEPLRIMNLNVNRDGPAMIQIVTRNMDNPTFEEFSDGFYKVGTEEHRKRLDSYIKKHPDKFITTDSSYPKLNWATQRTE